MGMIVLEAAAACFILLLSCVIGIQNGAVNMVFLYEKEVQDRVVEKGLITREGIKRNSLYFFVFGMIPFFAFLLISVYGLNGARGFMEGFGQMCVILFAEGLFDRLFIDWYWVGKTKTWIIPGTEDLMPYIYGKSLAIKWLSTLVGYPVMAAILALIMSLILK